MTREERLQIENQLLREYRLWYNPKAISDEELERNIKSQKSIIEMFEASYKQNLSEDTAKILVEEVMKVEIWKDILENRDPFKIKLDT